MIREHLLTVTYSCDQNIEQRWCKVCGCLIISGDANLLSHQASKAHKNKVQESKKKPTTITKFFAPPPKSQPPQQNPSSALLSEIVGGTKEIAIDVDTLQTSLTNATSAEGIQEPGTSISGSIQDNLHTALLSQLYMLTANLP